jgi:hypothetical protein
VIVVDEFINEQVLALRIRREGRDDATDARREIGPDLFIAIWNADFYYPGILGAVGNIDFEIGPELVIGFEEEVSRALLVNDPLEMFGNAPVRDKRSLRIGIDTRRLEPVAPFERPSGKSRSNVMRNPPCARRERDDNKRLLYRGPLLPARKSLQKPLEHHGSRLPLLGTRACSTVSAELPGVHSGSVL